jgi:phosphoribosylamine---glycine ligase
MKILFLSTDGSFAMAKRMQDEGHTVYAWSDEKPGHVGIVKNIIKDWKSAAKSCQLVVSDDVVTDKADIQDLRKPVVSSNDLFTKLENDRLFGKFAFQKVGLDVADCTHFTDFKKAIAFIKANPGRWVFKANGQANRVTGFVGKDDTGKDVIERLTFYESHLKNNKKLWDHKLGVDFVLERAVDGIEVACGAYWDGKDFVGLNLNWEHKRLGVGNVGVATGEMGTVIYGTTPETRLFRSTLAKLKPLLQSSPYHTYVDLNCIVDKEHAYILEVTARLGWPIETALDAMCNLGTTSRYAAMASGKLHNQSYFKELWGVVLTVGTFGFPYPVAYKEFGQEQPFILPEGTEKNIYFYGTDKVDGQYQTSKDGDGLVLVVVGTGSTLSGAKEKAYDVVEKLEIPGKIYRTDIGDKVPEYIKQLKSWGWI